MRGVRVVTDVGCGMRWTRRRARRSALTRTAKPCGPDAPTLAFKLATMLSHRAGDGGNKARSPGRARSKPLKPLRGEGRIDPTSPVVTNSCVFYFTHEATGAAGTRLSLRPLLRVALRPLLRVALRPLSRGTRSMQQLGRDRRGGNAKLCLRHCLRQT
jgi:hypothetical protein